MAKGSEFERLICSQLSEWWAGRDDIFWRATTSGARATTRAKKGKRTSGQYGDVTAIDPIGQPFLDLVTIEIKRGYSHSTPFDLFDRSGSNATQVWEKWIEQAANAMNAAGSASWMIVSRRNRKEAVITMPPLLYHSLFTKTIVPAYRIKTEDYSVQGTLFANLLEHVTPKHCKRLLKEL